MNIPPILGKFLSVLPWDRLVETTPKALDRASALYETVIRKGELETRIEEISSNQQEIARVVRRLAENHDGLIRELHNQRRRWKIVIGLLILSVIGHLATFLYLSQGASP